MDTIAARHIRTDDVVLMPNAKVIVRVVSVVTDLHTRRVRVSYANINTGKGMRTKTLKPFDQVGLYLPTPTHA